MTQAGPFLVYTTLPINLDPILKALNYGQFGDASHGDIWYSAPSTPDFVDVSPSAIVAHHREQPGTANKRHFVIVDRADWEIEGVLGVNLSFEGTCYRIEEISWKQFPSIETRTSLLNKKSSTHSTRPRFCQYHGSAAMQVPN